MRGLRRQWPVNLAGHLDLGLGAVLINKLHNPFERLPVLVAMLSQLHDDCSLRLRFRFFDLFEKRDVTSFAIARFA